MNSGITRWKVVPSYSDLPWIFCFELASVQSLVPWARPIKFATVSGASFENNLQVIRPIEVSKTAVGPVGCGLTGTCEPGESGSSWLGGVGFEDGGFEAAGVDCCAKPVSATANEKRRKRAIRNDVFMQFPKRTDYSMGRCEGNSPALSRNSRQVLLASDQRDDGENQKLRRDGTAQIDPDIDRPACSARQKALVELIC
jgi:hypothetical protein